jgi:leader peptidase (prepilin peptidase)/N-methyltransferase
MTEAAVFSVLAGLFGLLVGSFLNVCIYRWTRTPWDVIREQLARKLGPEIYEKWLQPVEVGGRNKSVLTLMFPDQVGAEYLREHYGAQIAAIAGTLGLGIESVEIIVDDLRPEPVGNYRLSVVRPRSACPVCGSPIAWYDNIPVLSYLLLRGRCRVCRTPISWTYPLVELLTALCFAFFAAMHGPSPVVAKDCLFSAILIGLIFSDLDTRLLPDEFTVGGLVAAIALAVFLPMPPGLFTWFANVAGLDSALHLTLRASSVGESVSGALVPAGAMWLLGWCFEKIRHKEYLGFGDVKMIAMIGAFLGISGAVVTLLLGSLFGSIGGLAYLKLTGKDPATYYLPFATFLGIAALAVTAANGGITGWYEQLLR